ncbi:hypothetical protein [Flavimaricola marinus]|uniref:Uncharacterized protein n=1 Tax=Flavimaricola marinus TaxID=1819565 RepID=A0A238LEF8_9RHOB|nr:hypothetical protein [Flavimaricola marinus]SMY07998.1 hypothetical protein LOM8899_02144 [Flavimaricola marinus]
MGEPVDRFSFAHDLVSLRDAMALLSPEALCQDYINQVETGVTVANRPALPGNSAYAIVLALILAGCSPAPQVSPGAPGAQTAYFASYPTDLLRAAFAACNAPGQTARRPTQGTVTCETLPSPDSAAALILAHDGTVEALPTYVIGFQTSATTDGYLVTADNYIRVPQFDGGVAQVRLPDEMIAEIVRDLLVSAGGTPLTP